MILRTFSYLPISRHFDRFIYVFPFTFFRSLFCTCTRTCFHDIHKKNQPKSTSSSPPINLISKYQILSKNTHKSVRDKRFYSRASPARDTPDRERLPHYGPRFSPQRYLYDHCYCHQPFIFLLSIAIKRFFIF